MAPKPAPKLTKKQLEELKKEQQRKKEAEERQRKQQEEARIKQRERLDQLQGEKRADQERIRIVLQKEKYRDELQGRIRDQKASIDKLNQQKKWSYLTEQYHKSYDTDGPKLSTFINSFQQEPYQGPQKTLKSCEEAQIYVRHIGHSMLESRSQGDKNLQKYYEESIKAIRKIQFENIEKIMIEMANSAQDMQDKNNQVSKKGEPNKKVQGLKILEYQQFMSKLAKIGMFLNSSTTKNLNKFRPIQIKQFGLNTQIPSKWMNSNTIVKFQWINFNPFNIEQYQKFLIIGGAYILEFYDLLIRSKKINNITLKKYYKSAEILQKSKLSANIIKQPFNITYQIPKYVFLQTLDQSTLKLAQFDGSVGRWVPLPNDTVIQYDSKDKKAICRIYRPEPIAYIQDRCTDYPYVAWELRSVQQGVAHLDIQLKRYHLPKEGQQTKQRLMLKFEINSTSVKLITDEDYPQLRDLRDGQWTPAGILYELSERGIHLLPIDEDYQEAKLPVKNKQAEENAIRDIAYALQAFYIRSEINSSSDIIVKIRENLQFERVFLQDQQKDWKKIRWLSNNRCEVTNRNIRERHINLQVLLANYNFCQPQCLDRIKYDKNFLFKRNIMEMLSLTRILSFIDAKEEDSQLRWALKEKELVRL